MKKARNLEVVPINVETSPFCEILDELSIDYTMIHKVNFRQLPGKIQNRPNARIMRSFYRIASTS
jgi:hypothetical protein